MLESFMASLAVGASFLADNVLFSFLIGAVGALVKDISDDGSLTLPSIQKGKFYIGFGGGIIIGGCAGLLTGGDILTEFLAGFAGYSVIASLVAGKTAGAQAIHEANTAIIAATIQTKPTTTITPTETPQETITRIANANNTNLQLALAVAEAESSFNPTITHANADGSTDRGLYQINSKWHPEVTEAQAFNSEFAAQFFCDAVKDGNLSWWNASKPRWIDKVFAA